MKKSLQNGYEVVSKDDEIGYARLPRDDVSGGVWAVLNEGASKAATNYKTTIRSATRSAGAYANPSPKDQYYSPYHPNTILTPDTNIDTHTLLWIKRVPEQIEAGFDYTLNLLAVIGYRNNNSFGFLCRQQNEINKNCRWRVFQFQYCAVSISPEYSELLDVSRPTLCHVHHHHHVEVRWEEYRTELRNKARLWKDKANEANKAI